MEVAPPCFDARSIHSPPSDDGKDPETLVSFQTSVLISSSHGIVLGASTWFADGQMFVVTDEQLPVGTHVDLSFATPGGRQTLRASGHVGFQRQARDPESAKRPGLGIDIDSVDKVAGPR